ncbi:hypothetical protein ACTFIY_004513, partial [Dictyostelium cf. discoideum]
IKRRNGLGYVRYRLHRLAGILPLLACVNGHIRHPRRQLEFEQICNHYNIASKIPDKLTSENGWISGYFDAVGLFEFSTEQDQLYLAFRHKINPMLDEIQKCLGVTLPSDVCSCENVTLYNISKKNWLRFYEYFKKHPLRSSKKKHLVLLPKYYELQTDTKDMQNLEVKQNLWKQFFKTCTATMKELEKEQKDAQFHIHMRIKSEQNQFITWLAGLLDSCGNIMLSKKHVSGNIEIKLKLKDHECLEKIKLKYGGAVKVSRTGTRYRLNHQEGLKFLLEDINGQIRLPVRLEKFKEVCKKNEIEMKHPDKELRLDNSWISGFFDGVGSIVINQTTLENKKQLVFTFNHKNISSEAEKGLTNMQLRSKFVNQLIGLQDLEKKPAYVVLLDAIQGKYLISESEALGIPTIGCGDTTINLPKLKYPLIGNFKSREKRGSVLLLMKHAMFEGMRQEATIFAESMNLIDLILIAIYVIGISGLIFNKNNIINILIISELNLGTLGMLFVLASVELNDILGELSGLYILTFTAAESAIGLAIVVILYSKTGIINIRHLNKLKG